MNLEKSELSWVGILNKVAFNSIEGSHVHVAVRVEVVHKLNLVQVFKEEVSHCASFGLREREGTRERFTARVLSAALVSVGKTIVTVQVYTSLSVITTKPLSSP